MDLAPVRMLSVAAVTLVRSTCLMADLALVLRAAAAVLRVVAGLALAAVFCGGFILIAFGLHDLGFLAAGFSIALDRNSGYTLGSLSASSLGFNALKWSLMDLCLEDILKEQQQKKKKK